MYQVAQKNIINTIIYYNMNIYYLYVLTSLVDTDASFLIFSCHLHFWFKCQLMREESEQAPAPGTHSWLLLCPVTWKHWLVALHVVLWGLGENLGPTNYYLLLPSIGSAAGRKFPYLSWPGGNQRFTWHKSSAHASRLLFPQHCNNMHVWGLNFWVRQFTNSRHCINKI